MVIDRDFNVLAYVGSESSSSMMKAICSEVKLPCIDVSERIAFLESLLDDEPDLIVFHTDIGEEEIVDILEIMKVDSLYRTIPVIIISKLTDNDAFALRLSAYEVISILTYENWKYQCQKLLAYLKSKRDHTSSLHENLLHSESKNAIDPLTGALNRFGAEHRYEQLVAYNGSNGEVFSIIIFDIDYFKKVNDLHGHDTGDQVLVGMSSLVKSAIRKDDALIRFGGEEFIVFLANTELEAAQRSAEKLRLLIESTSFSNSGLRITASFGVVQYSPGERMNLLIEKADEYLYAAKRGGRNQVCSA
jgi:diguanylate cyclase (GGDEF)-like protein